MVGEIPGGMGDRCLAALRLRRTLQGTEDRRLITEN
jgi:hypothetical protein